MKNYDYSNLLSMIEEIISFWIYYNRYVHDIIQVRITPNVKAQNQHNYSN